MSGGSARGGGSGGVAGTLDISDGPCEPAPASVIGSDSLASLSIPCISPPIECVRDGHCGGARRRGGRIPERGFAAVMGPWHGRRSGTRSRVAAGGACHRVLLRRRDRSRTAPDLPPGMECARGEPALTEQHQGARSRRRTQLEQCAAPTRDETRVRGQRSGSSSRRSRLCSAPLGGHAYRGRPRKRHPSRVRRMRTSLSQDVCTTPCTSRAWRHSRRCDGAGSFLPAYSSMPNGSLELEPGMNRERSPVNRKHRSDAGAAASLGWEPVPWPVLTYSLFSR